MLHRTSPGAALRAWTSIHWHIVKRCSLAASRHLFSTLSGQHLTGPASLKMPSAVSKRMTSEAEASECMTTSSRQSFAEVRTCGATGLH